MPLVRSTEVFAAAAAGRFAVGAFNADNNESVVGAIERGVCKVNVATYLKQAFVEEIRAALANDPDEVDFRRLFLSGREAAKERGREKLRLFRASGRISSTGGFRSPPVQRRSAVVTGID